MGGGDQIRALFRPDAAQESVTQAARRGLQPLAAHPRGGHVFPAAAQGHVEPRAQRLAKRHVRDGFPAADAVLKVRRPHLHAALQQQKQERH